MRRTTLRRKYGMTEDDYLALYETQGGVCAICKQPPVGNKGLGVDHDHNTGVVRGLLCMGCNTGIGNLRESPQIMLAAIDYLVTRSTEL